MGRWAHTMLLMEDVVLGFVGIHGLALEKMEMRRKRRGGGGFSFYLTFLELKGFLVFYCLSLSVYNFSFLFFLKKKGSNPCLYSASAPIYFNFFFNIYTEKTFFTFCLVSFFM